MIPTPTTQQWEDWRNHAAYPTTPEDITSLLHKATLLVANHIRSCHTPPGSEQAITDATCTQAAFWHDHGITPLAGGTQGGTTIASASLLTASVTYADSEHATSMRARAEHTLCDEALLVLTLAGITPRHPGVIG